MSEFNSSNPDTNTAAETIAVASQQAHSPTGGEPPPVIATGYEGSVADQLRASVQRIRGGEMGMLPGPGRPAGPQHSLRLPEPVLLHQGQRRQPDDADRGVDDAVDRAHLRDHPDGDRPLRRHHRWRRHGGLHHPGERQDLELDFGVHRRAACRRGDRYEPGLVRGEGRHSVVRGQSWPIPGFPRLDAGSAGRRRHLPDPDAGSCGHHEQVDAAVGRLADARHHRSGLPRHRSLRPHASAGGANARPANEFAARPGRGLGSRRRVHGVPAEPEPGQRAHPDRGGADRGTDRPDDPVGRHVDARPEPFRPAHLRGWWQSRGSQAGGYQCSQGADHGLHHLLDAGGRLRPVHGQPDRRRAVLDRP